jgi:hypothetical protein
MLDGTELYEYCLFTITDGDITYILIHGTFVANKEYILIKMDLQEDFQIPRISEELKEKGLDPARTRLVCIAVNSSEEEPGAQKLPEIQIIMIPF